ncbi:MAG: hypothetical protein ACFFCI_19725 [Promethearchaeota archaeon]
MTDSRFGNGKLLAETLKKEFSDESTINIADVKDVSPKSIAEDVPDVLILGGAIRIFRGAPKSKRWLKKINKILENSGETIQYGTGFLTHSMPTEKVQGYSKRFREKLEKASMIKKTYSDMLTARVERIEGPIFPEEMEKGKVYIKNFIEWLK